MQEIPVSQLHLDKSNPRLPLSKRGDSEVDIINYLLLEASTIELMEAIGESGFFSGELLLVVKNDDGGYTVVEGNRRLCSVKLLKDPSLAKYKKSSVQSIASSVRVPAPDKLPCLIFPRRESILNYLGFVHVTGKQSWGQLQKGRYLYEYYTRMASGDYTADCKKIAKVIGSTSPYVARLLRAFSIYLKVEDEGFYSIEGLSDISFHLNYLVDGLNKENIRKFLNVNLSEDNLDDVNLDNLELLVHWWFEKTEGQSRIKGDSESLKMLNAILGNAVALDAFQNKGVTIERAYMMTDDFGTQIQRSLKMALQELENADDLVVNIDKFDQSILNDLSAIRKIASKITSYIKAISEDDDE